MTLARLLSVGHPVDHDTLSSGAQALDLIKVWRAAALHELLTNHLRLSALAGQLDETHPSRIDAVLRARR